jgi:hypothetical protein
VHHYFVFSSQPNVTTSEWSGCSHQLLLGTFRADDVFSIGDEPSSNQRCLARSADETVIVPVAVFKRDESGTPNTCDGLGASSAPLGKELTKAISAVWLLITGSEALSGQ